MANDPSDPNSGGVNKEAVETAKALNAVIKDIALLFGNINTSSKSLTDHIAKSAKQGLDFEKVLTDVLFNSENLGKKFKSTNDIQKKMQTDSKYFLKMQKEIWKTVEVGLKEAEAAAKKKLDDEEESIKKELDHHDKLEKFQKQRQQAEEQLSKVRKDITNDFERNLNLTARQLELNKKVTLSMRNVSDIVDDMGQKIRNPSLQAESLLTNIGGWAPALLKANQEGKSFTEIIGGLASKGRAGIASFGALFGATGILIVGVAAAVAVVATLYKLFVNYWDFLDKKVIPANAEFNKQIGVGTKQTART